MRSDLSDTQKLATLIHEIGHKEMHSLDKGSHKSSIVKEFEADGYTIMLSEALGIPINEGTKFHMHSVYMELIKDIPTIPKDEPVFSALDENVENPGLEKKDIIERSFQTIVSQFNIAQKTLIPHISEYLSVHSLNNEPKKDHETVKETKGKQSLKDKVEKAEIKATEHNRSRSDIKNRTTDKER